MTTLTDDFNRADDASSVGTASDGGTWTVHGGTWGIRSNRLYPSSTAGGSILSASSSYRLIRRDLGAASCDVTITNYKAGTSGFNSIWFAFDPATTDGYYVTLLSSAVFNVYKFSGGTATQLGTMSGVAWTGGSTTLRITYDAATGVIAVYQNGTFVGSVTDAGVTLTGTWVGPASNVASAAAGDREFDDFTAMPLSAPVPPPPRRPLIVSSAALQRAHCW